MKPAKNCTVDEALVEMIEERGCAWDPVLFRGDECDLHDLRDGLDSGAKARCVRVTYWNRSGDRVTGSLATMLADRRHR